MSTISPFFNQFWDSIRQRTSESQFLIILLRILALWISGKLISKYYNRKIYNIIKIDNISIYKDNTTEIENKTKDNHPKNSFPPNSIYIYYIKNNFVQITLSKFSHTSSNNNNVKNKINENNKNEKKNKINEINKNEKKNKINEINKNEKKNKINEINKNEKKNCCIKQKSPQNNMNHKPGNYQWTCCNTHGTKVFSNNPSRGEKQNYLNAWKGFGRQNDSFQRINCQYFCPPKPTCDPCIQPCKPFREPPCYLSPNSLSPCNPNYSFRSDPCHQTLRYTTKLLPSEPCCSTPIIPYCDPLPLCPPQCFEPCTPIPRVRKCAPSINPCSPSTSNPCDITFNDPSCEQVLCCTICENLSDPSPCSTGKQCDNPKNCFPNDCSQIICCETHNDLCSCETTQFKHKVGESECHKKSKRKSSSHSKIPIMHC